jgi:SAM-dependent methyltransferase
LASAFSVPVAATLRLLQKEGARVGYRGFSIYVRYRAVLQSLQGVSASRALGIGVGYGIFDRLLPEGLEYVGLDVDEQAIAFAAEWAGRHRRNFRYVTGPVAAHAFQKNSFDLILLSEVVEHVPEDGVAPLIEEVDRVLAPGGHILLSVPNHHHLRNRVRRLVGLRTVLMDSAHLREYDLTGAFSLCRAFGGEMLSFRPAVLYFPLERLWERILPPAGAVRSRILQFSPSLASHFVFLIRKPISGAVS